MTTLYMTFAIGSDYNPQTLVGVARTFTDSLEIQNDHLRREAPMANGCMTFTAELSEAQAEQLLKVRNPFPNRIYPDDSARD